MVPGVSFVPIGGHARTSSRLAAPSVLAANLRLFAPSFLHAVRSPRGTSLASRAQQRPRASRHGSRQNQNPSSQGGENAQGFQDEAEEVQGLYADRTARGGGHHRHPGRDRDPAVLGVSVAGLQRPRGGRCPNAATAQEAYFVDNSTYLASGACSGLPGF